MTRPITAIISCDALKNNLNVIRKIVPKSYVWSVVKANGYGHGLNNIWCSLSETDGFALLNIEDAIFLRKKGWKKPILMLGGFFTTDELMIFDQYRLTTTVYSNWQIEQLLHAKFLKPLDIYIKVNSGMNRLGFKYSQVYSIWKALVKSRNVNKITLMSHFACPKNSNNVSNVIKHIKKINKMVSLPCSIASSAAILWYPESHLNWVRAGIILYGASPNGDWQDIENFNLKPVMTLKSKIICVQNIYPGDGVGYNYHYRSTRKKRIGIVACGYADGYPRTSINIPVYVDGVQTITVGSISMDMLAIDLTPCPRANIGTSVELWGNNIKIDNIAKKIGTVGYELMCSLSNRVPIITN